MKVHDLPPWLEKIEEFVDRCIPWMLVILTVLIILEFTHIAENWHDTIILLDYIIISFFVIDLLFKWHRTRNVLKFMKLYWIDIIAVFPFYAVFRVYALASEAVAAGETVQKFLHEGVLLRETKLLREAELTARFAKEARFVRLFARGLRVLKARWYITNWHLQNSHRRSKV